MRIRYFVSGLVVSLVIPSISFANTIEFASDSGWLVSNSLNHPLGTAQTVCLTDTLPSTCPEGATRYGFAGIGWEADLTPIPGAQWIWAPGVTGSTTPSELAAYTFSQSFLIESQVTDAELFIAADDFASIAVNGQLVATIGSTTDIATADLADAHLTVFDIASFLSIGENSIEVTGQNGIGAFAGCSNCTYAQQPAGVVFGGSITTISSVPTPPEIWLFGSGLIGLLGIGRFTKPYNL